MPSAEVTAFIRANLPAPPARVLEVGAGEGELARVLVGAGYGVVAIDPATSADDVTPISLIDLDEPRASFDAAVAIVSLHHVNPLDASCRRLAEMLRPGALLLIDEFDVESFDERAATWWLERRRELGSTDDVSPGQLVADHRAELHPLADIERSLVSGFELGRPIRGSYLYRWDLNAALREVEEELIAAGRLPAVGVRLVGVRRLG